MQSAAIGTGLFVAGAAAALELRREIEALEEKIKASQGEKQRARAHALQPDAARQPRDAAALAEIKARQERLKEQQDVFEQRLAAAIRRVDSLEKEVH